MLKLLDILHLHYRHVISLILCCFCHKYAIFLCVYVVKCASLINLEISIFFFNITFLRKGHNYIASCNAQPPKKNIIKTKLFLFSLHHVYSKGCTDIRSHGHSFHAIFDRAGHSCSHQMTTPDIRAHIKLPPWTFLLISNYHTDIRSHDYSVLERSTGYSLSACTKRLVTICPPMQK